jgi:hypothetical protein
MKDSKITPRAIHSIAADITREWKNVYFGAVPYLNAMRSLYSISESYYYDRAETVIIHFLANAQTFRGEQARALKLELNNLLIGKTIK